MKNLLITMFFVVGCVCAWAQNPVSDALRDRLTREAKVTVGAAEEMPADKYGYKPTEAQVPFGHWVSHAAGANYFLCSKLSGGTAPQAGVKETDAKDKLIDAMKKSFDYCTTELGKLQDSQLKDEITLFGDRKTTKGGAALELSADWADHYSQMASYLRLNGLLPPTAKKKE
ncbi:MAG TPA: DinB family protein [Terriglobales bacterium]|nr:DinB family protein [Terriglobales bacterium]